MRELDNFVETVWVNYSSKFSIPEEYSREILKLYWKLLKYEDLLSVPEFRGEEGVLFIPCDFEEAISKIIIALVMDIPFSVYYDYGREQYIFILKEGDLKSKQAFGYLSEGLYGTLLLRAILHDGLSKMIHKDISLDDIKAVLSYPIALVPESDLAMIVNPFHTVGMILRDFLPWREYLSLIKKTEGEDDLLVVFDRYTAQWPDYTKPLAHKLRQLLQESLKKEDYKIAGKIMAHIMQFLPVTVMSGLMSEGVPVDLDLMVETMLEDVEPGYRISVSPFETVERKILSLLRRSRIQ